MIKLPRVRDTKGGILGLLSDCRPRSFSDIVKETGLGRKAVEGALYRLWRGERSCGLRSP